MEFFPTYTCTECGVSRPTWAGFLAHRADHRYGKVVGYRPGGGSKRRLTEEQREQRRAYAREYGRRRRALIKEGTTRCGS